MARALATTTGTLFSYGADGAPRAVLLDRGPREGADPARHLRLALHRRDLLSGGEEGEEATRWPVWRFYGTEGG
jgi:hypothetical protein